MDRTASDGSIDIELRGAIAVMTINRPAKHNAFTLDMVGAINDGARRLADDERVRAMVLTGAGERAFSVGGDLATLLPATVAAGRDIVSPDPRRRFFSDVYLPIVCAVRGLCIGGGLELMLGTDLRVASTDASFGLGEVRWGLVPGAGTHVRLPRQVPWAIAMQLLLTAEPVSAQAALGAGLVNEVVAPDDVVPRAIEWAEMIAANGPVAVRTAKEIAVRALGLEDGFALEHELNARVLRSDDAAEGPRAFVEGRPPRFTGR